MFTFRYFVAYPTGKSMTVVICWCSFRAVSAGVQCVAVMCCDSFGENHQRQREVGIGVGVGYVGEWG